MSGLAKLSPAFRVLQLLKGATHRRHQVDAVLEGGKGAISGGQGSDPSLTGTFARTRFSWKARAHCRWCRLHERSPRNPSESTPASGATSRDNALSGTPQATRPVKPGIERASGAFFPLRVWQTPVLGIGWALPFNVHG